MSHFLTQRSTASAKQTIDLGKDLGSRLHAGSVVALHGLLGVGKTVLVKGIAESLQIVEPITSPSFTLLSEYGGSLAGKDITLYHIDLYRIAHPLELLDLGLEEILNAGGISVVEWAEKASGLLPGDAVTIDISIEPNGRRKIMIRGLRL